jgi:ABC-type multidrug transport system ATPase subunit
MHNDTILKIKDLTISHDGESLITGLDIELKSGEKAALKGPSGSGKSSLLAAVMGFLTPDKGEINILGNSVFDGDIDERRSHVCWLPQNVAAPGQGRVGDVIKRPFSYSQNRGMDPADSEIRHMLVELGLNDNILSKEFQKISGGEKQRIGLLICKLLKRPLILLDEPTSALDYSAIGRAVDFMLGDRSFAVLSISHQSEWLDRCDKIIKIGGNK